MTRRIFILLVVGFYCCFAFGQNRIDSLSSSAQLSILTVSPGQSLETLFGHSGIRIYDPVLRINKVYNYGTFDFEEPHYAINFLKGKLNYWLATGSFANFLYAYKLENRGVWEQVLELDPQVKQEVYNFLETNHLPENKNYLYDFFFDNCSTRIRDVFEQTLPKFNYKGIVDQETTYRKLLDQYLDNREWTDFGMDLILGLPSDQIANFEDQMYLPDYLMKYAEHMYYEGQGNEQLKLVQQSEQVLIQNPIQNPSYFLTPFRLFAFFLLIEVLLLIFRNRVSNRVKKIYDYLWFTVLFLGSLVILFMWFGTDHKVCKDNLNILWVSPLPLIIQFFKPRFKRILSIGMIFYFVVFITFWTLWPQGFSIISILISSILVLKFTRITLENI